ncbi:CIC11C00000005320 [Sungouiella intermedia]|uniref:CIC11C00000005320 n=1 Tax=Sungouiella intermedia TaxID=45354 RepID=A0A1L0DPW8_9ASCO|nr:CIC11C00000005320 [[Candida] intermedia]
MMKLPIRNFASSTRYWKGTIFPKFSSHDELAAFLRKPTWRVRDVIPVTSNNSTVDARVVRKMLKLSGLNTDITKEQEDQWIVALNKQVAFINHLDDSCQTEPGSNGSEVFRLIASDHNPPEPLTLKKLLQEVEKVDQEMDVTKGEEGFSTSEFRTVVNETRS